MSASMGDELPGPVRRSPQRSLGLLSAVLLLIAGAVNLADGLSTGNGLPLAVGCLGLVGGTIMALAAWGVVRLYPTPEPSRWPSTEMAMAEVQRLARAGRKIEAIRVYREATGAGLAAAKSAVEDLQRAR
jgi:hypothetical protein